MEAPVIHSELVIPWTYHRESTQRRPRTGWVQPSLCHHRFAAREPISISLLAGDGVPDSRPESCSALLGLPREFPDDVPPEGDEDDDGDGFTLTTDDDEVVVVIDRSVFFKLPAEMAPFDEEPCTEDESLALGMDAIWCRLLLFLASALAMSSSLPSSPIPPSTC